MRTRMMGCSEVTYDGIIVWEYEIQGERVFFETQDPTAISDLNNLALKAYFKQHHQVGNDYYVETNPRLYEKIMGKGE